MIVNTYVYKETEEVYLFCVIKIKKKILEIMTVVLFQRTGLRNN
jgi:hypothetical protein